MKLSNGEKGIVHDVLFVVEESLRGELNFDTGCYENDELGISLEKEEYEELRKLVKRFAEE